jgi:hypothetical protein
MADYVPPLGTRTNPRKPVTSEWAKAADDRPIAVAEGAPDAPKVQGVALGGVSMGAIVVTGTGGQGYTNCDRMELVRADISGNSPSEQLLRARYSNDNGATWGSWQDIVTTLFGVDSGFAGSMRINLRTGAVYIAAAQTTAAFSASPTHTVPTGCNAFQLGWQASGNTMYADFYCLGGVP